MDLQRTPRELSGRAPDEIFVSNPKAVSKSPSETLKKGFLNNYLYYVGGSEFSLLFKAPSPGVKPASPPAAIVWWRQGAFGNPMASPLLPEARGAPCRFLEEFHVSRLRSWDSAKSRDCHLGLRCKLQTVFHAEFGPGASVA